MIKLENLDICGLEATIRGMRNPKNSWNKSDSHYALQSGMAYDTGYSIGPTDMDLMLRLAKGGPVHAKYRRMIVVYVDITAPLYWWKEFDTYKVGTVSNSCSTMHKIAAKEFTLDDFSHEHLLRENDELMVPEYYERRDPVFSPESSLEIVINALNNCRENYLETKDKIWWWQMIQLLPSSYNQKRTIMLNYEVLHNIYFSRKDHKLDEWRIFGKFIEDLPYSEIITMNEE